MSDMKYRYDSVVPSHTSLRILSHPLCPLRQRLALILMFKGLTLGTDFESNDLELGNIPEWFRELSPAGSMPVLVLGDKQCLTTHSGVAAEFLNELTTGDLFPTEPMNRLRHRNALALADGLLDKLRNVFTAAQATDVEQALDDIFHGLIPLEEQLSDESSWYDQEASMVDAAFAPIFCLALYFEGLADDPRWRHIPRTRKWGEYLSTHPIVHASLPENIDDEFRKFFSLFKSAFAERTKFSSRKVA